MATGLEAGRYCETVGWLSMSGIQSNTYFGKMNPAGVPNPSRIAVKPANSSSSASTASGASTLKTMTITTRTTQTTCVTGSGAASTSSAVSNPYRYSRRYLDWNRLTFAYHANGSQGTPFDIDKGLSTSSEATAARTALNLTNLYGCAPETYCQTCKPFGTEGNIFGLLTTALAATVINETRKDIPRLIIINTGTIRFDLVEGPFTYDDPFIVSPFLDSFQFIPNVPYNIASQVLGILVSLAVPRQTGSSLTHPQNAGPNQKRDLDSKDFNFAPFTGEEACVDPKIGSVGHDLKKRSTRGMIRRDAQTLVPGYVTTDDFGNDGDDTPHSPIPAYKQPNDIQANASFPTDGSMPKTVDLVFLDFIATGYVLPALKSLGASYTVNDVTYYVPQNFTTNSYLPAYAKIAWQKNVPNCPVGQGVGFNSTS